MVINRRRFLRLGGACAVAALLPDFARAQERFIPAQGPWRKFDLVAQLKLAKPEGKAQAWIPVPSVNEEDWSKALGSDWKTNAKTARLEQDQTTGAALVYLEWDGAASEAAAEISSHAEMRDRITDFTKPEKQAPLPDEERQRYTAPTSFIPHDARLQETAADIIQNAKTDLGKAKAIYEWIVDEQSCDVDDLKTLFGDPANPASGPQDCAYLNSLFVGLARIAGLPAREIYGVRVAPSQFGYESLGAVSEDITAKTLSRAEVWLMDYGWVPVDPGDMRRVIRDEPPGNLELTDPKAVAARMTLFGSWEGNWLAFNMANDLALPESGGATVPYLAAPVIKTAAGLTGGEKLQGFSYKLMATELPA